MAMDVTIKPLRATFNKPNTDEINLLQDDPKAREHASITFKLEVSVDTPARKNNVSELLHLLEVHFNNAATDIFGVDAEGKQKTGLYIYVVPDKGGIIKSLKKATVLGALSGMGKDQIAESKRFVDRVTGKHTLTTQLLLSS